MPTWTWEPASRDLWGDTPADLPAPVRPRRPNLSYEREGRGRGCGGEGLPGDAPSVRVRDPSGTRRPASRAGHAIGARPSVVPGDGPHIDRRVRFVGKSPTQGTCSASGEPRQPALLGALRRSGGRTSGAPGRIAFRNVSGSSLACGQGSPRSGWESIPARPRGKDHVGRFGGPGVDGDRGPRSGT